MNKLVLLCGLLALGADLGVAQTRNLAELAGDLGLNKLVELLGKAGLANTIATGGPFTVFGPTDAAFDALPQSVKDIINNNNTALAEVLKYHVLNGKTMSSQLTNEMVVPSLQAASVRINIYQNKAVITATGSKVTNPDQEATNGVIHVVQRVMWPIPTKNVPVWVTDMPNYSTLLTAVTKANLVTTLAGPGPFTVFGPDNNAFNALPAGALDYLLGNVTALTMVLKYHVVSGTYYSVGLTSGDVPTLEGSNVAITVGSGVKVNSANVAVADQAVTNGVIHGIDAVLVPSSVVIPTKPTGGAASLQATTLMLVLLSVLFCLW